jgi:hypothetical protein
MTSTIDQDALTGVEALLGLDPAPVTGVGEDSRALVEVATRRPITRDTAPRRATPSPTLDATDRVRELWDAGVEDSRRLARSFASLAPSWMDRDTSTDADVAQDRAVEDMLVATAQRITLAQARSRIGQAHRAVHLLPRCWARLADGELPAPWFEDLLRRTRDLSDAQMRLLDVTVAAWDLRITPDRFTRELRRLIALVRSREPDPAHLDPEARRRVETFAGRGDGTACMQIHGPIPEIVAFSRRLDAAARAAQAAQRRALREGTEIPVDPDGVVEETGMVLSLAVLRYHLLTSADLAVDGVQVPAPRFRIGMTVPALTLMGHSDAPGVLDGRWPVPAEMARDLAAGDDAWFRILTDPSSGEILPVRQDRYSPTPEMLEHLRVRMVSCGAPGCDRPASWDTEADHVEEFDHRDPAAGGPTSVENLHLLCWQHHHMKTDRRIDPQRVSSDSSPTGVSGTWWTVQDAVRIFLEDDTDMLTPMLVAELEEEWARYRRKAPPPPDQDPPPGPPPPF